MTKYSIAIRTLGTSGEKFVRELESIKRQTVQPEKVVIYIAEGYKRPEYTIGKEEYVWVKKGMMYQRVLPYDEIDTPLIMLLDDDVELADNSAQKLIEALEEHNFDCISAVTFRNYKILVLKKIYIAVTNLVFPHWSETWAVKIHSNGSFSYNNSVKRDIYLSQSGSGPASMWKKSVFHDLRLTDELWLEQFGFPFGEDVVMFNKLYKNGYCLAMHYRCGIIHLDGKSSSDVFQKNPKKFHTRSMASLMIWHRTCFNLKGLPVYKKAWAAISFTFKVLWLFLVHIGASIYLRSPKVLWYYSKGVYDGLKMINSSQYRQIPNYILR
jgi:GT2 family glycosyltransferase